MNFETIIIYLSLSVSTLVLFFIIWDHLKDDRILTKEVQEFYNEIENLIFTNIQIEYYKIIESDKNKDFEKLNKYRNRDVIQNSYLKSKINQNLDRYSNYLGLTLKIEENSYLNGTVYILKESGQLLKRNIETYDKIDFIESYTDIKEKEVNEVQIYLNSLRFYWKKHYSKLIFRPLLKTQFNYNDLLGYSNPLEKKKVKRKYLSYKRKVK